MPFIAGTYTMWCSMYNMPMNMDLTAFLCYGSYCINLFLQIESACYFYDKRIDKK